jgi:methylated-DNA-[protein]-cysteine S-methyltransferase
MLMMELEMAKKSNQNVVYTCEVETPLGLMTAEAQNIALTGLWFNDQMYSPLASDSWVNDPDRPLFKELRAWLYDYFRGIAVAPDIKLEPHGTTFQMAVWAVLLKIPFGQVTTYGQIARAIDAARGTVRLSSQAVGGAVGHNPISILIPCHRVVGSDRTLTGYGGGLDKKKALLELERVNLQVANLGLPGQIFP